MKATLVSALSACAGERQRGKARRFLQGLSADELQYIADFLGAYILESALGREPSPDALARGFGGLDCCRLANRQPSVVSEGLNDREHKLIVLFEYLGLCGCSRIPMAPAAGQAG